jgi:thioredoxin 1
MSVPKPFNTVQEIQERISKVDAVLLYFNTNSCSVGEALEPKVLNLVKKTFQKIEIHTIDINFHPEISAHFNAFVEPTILVFFDGKETVRRSRNISVFELEEAIKRPYQLIF